MVGWAPANRSTHGGGIAEEGDARVQPEERGGEPGGDRPGEQTFERGALVASADHQQDFARREEVRHTEREAVRGTLTSGRQHAVLEGGGGELGHVGEWLQGRRRLVETKVAIDAQAENAQVNGTVRLEPGIDPMAFELGIVWTAPEAVQGLAPAQRFGQQPSKIELARGRVVLGEPAPFVEFEQARAAKDRRLLGEEFVRPPRRAPRGQAK